MFENDVVYVGRYCPFCGQYHEVLVYEDDYAAWQNGALVQEVFDYLTPNEREILISGICPKCWDKMFPEEEEEDDSEIKGRSEAVYEDCIPGDCEVCDCRDFCGEATL